MKTILSRLRRLERRTLRRRFVGVIRSWFRFFPVVNGLGRMEFAYLFGSLLGILRRP